MNTTDLPKFLKTSQQRTTLETIKNNLAYNIGKYNESVPKGKEQFKDLEYVRKLANERKRYAIEHLPTLLSQFEANISHNGATVLWAKDNRYALKYILQICNEKRCTTVVKSKSMVTEEIHLNHHLEKKGITVWETDLGEFIQQLSNEPPIHILTPAMHRSKEEVAELFHKKLHVQPDLSPENLTKAARRELRPKYREAEIGITGANFILPDIGGIAITENEGNARLTVTYPKTHIVLVGIEKIIPSYKDLALFWPLLSTYGTGQYITTYSNIITGPKKENEKDGPEHMYIILLDNGRTNILADPTMRESLFCIRCGACLNVCPIYKNVAGGHAYRTTYSGPIGSVISPHLRGLENYGHLSYASSLCGACTEVCPIKIPLHKLLLENRKKVVQKNHVFFSESFIWALWSILMRTDWLYRLIPYFLKKTGTRYFFKSWNKNRTPIPFTETTFKKQWKNVKEKEKKQKNKSIYQQYV